jgi:hypothetical protein
MTKLKCFGGQCDGDWVSCEVKQYVHTAIKREDGRMTEQTYQPRRILFEVLTPVDATEAELDEICDKIYELAMGGVPA